MTAQTETLDPDAAQAAVEHCYDQGWSDGLPVVPATQPLVDEFLAALPEKRKNVLQIVWAFLPDACDEGAPGCATRGELDRVCGSAFDKCQVTYQPPDSTLAVKH